MTAPTSVLPRDWFSLPSAGRAYRLLEQAQAFVGSGLRDSPEKRERLQAILQNVNATKVVSISRSVEEQTRAMLGLLQPMDTSLNFDELKSLAEGLVRYHALHCDVATGETTRENIPEGATHTHGSNQDFWLREHEGAVQGWAVNNETGQWEWRDYPDQEYARAFVWNRAVPIPPKADGATGNHSIDRGKEDRAASIMEKAGLVSPHDCDKKSAWDETTLEMAAPLSERIVRRFNRVMGYHAGGYTGDARLRPEEVAAVVATPDDVPTMEKFDAHLATHGDKRFPCEGYERLHDVYRDAHDHAAYTKGKERHANDLPFHEQRMQTISQGLNSPGGMAYQVIKKVQEGLQMKDYGACRKELLGALNYLAGIVIFLDDREAGGDQ